MLMIERWERFIDRIRYFFKERKYIEVTTPILRRFPNLDSNVEPIELVVETQGEKARYWLHTSPEYAMKKLFSKYKKDIFQITKVFRNKEAGSLNSAEFTMLEWYKKEVDYKYLIAEIKDLLRQFGYEEFEEITVEEAFERYADVILSEDEDIFKNNLITAGYEFDEEEDWETIFYRIYVEIERFLGREKPTFLINFPSRINTLAKIRNGFTERFELYINGVEIGNGWTEETDIEEVKKRLETESLKRNLPIDKEFLECHKDIPDCAGCSLGLERLFIVLEGMDSIHKIEFMRV